MSIGIILWKWRCDFHTEENAEKLNKTVDLCEDEVILPVKIRNRNLSSRIIEFDHWQDEQKYFWYHRCTKSGLSKTMKVLMNPYKIKAKKFETRNLELPLPPRSQSKKSPRPSQNSLQRLYFFLLGLTLSQTSLCRLSTSIQHFDSCAVLF